MKKGQFEKHERVRIHIFHSFLFFYLFRLKSMDDSESLDMICSISHYSKNLSWAVLSEITSNFFEKKICQEYIWWTNKFVQPNQWQVRKLSRDTCVYCEYLTRCSKSVRWKSTNAQVLRFLCLIYAPLFYALEHHQEKYRLFLENLKRHFQE